MLITPLETHFITKEDFLEKILVTYVPTLEENNILVITSKIISILEGSVVSKKDAPSKSKLIQDTADAYLNAPNTTILTLMNHLIVPTAGIDESSGEDLYILHPKDSEASAKTIWDYLRKRDQIKKLGIIITDSHSTPLRRGSLGVSLGWCGFKPLYSYIGKPDCLGKPLTVSQVNVVDSLAAAAVLCMGEGDEKTPLALIKNAPRVEFEKTHPQAIDKKNLYLTPEEDLYRPLLERGDWVFKTTP